jgi:hypothetical protein
MEDNYILFEEIAKKNREKVEKEDRAKWEIK